MNILEVSMHAQQIATKHVLCANTLLCTGHVPQFPRILNKESRRSGLRRNPLEEWEMCDREGKTAKGGLSTELSSLGQLQHNSAELPLPGRKGPGHAYTASYRRRSRGSASSP